MLILELTVYFMRILFGQVGTWTDPSIQKLPDIELPLIKDIPVKENPERSPTLWYIWPGLR